MAKAMSDGKKRRHFITYKAVDSLSSTLRDKFLAARNRKKESCTEGCMRYFNFMRFCLGCSVSLFQVMAPWVLSTIELVSILLLYFIGTSKSIIIHQATSNYHFSWQCSLEDIIGLAIARSLILSSTYAWEVHHMQSAGNSAHRTYLFTSYLLAALCFPYIIMKTILFHYSQDAVPASAIFIITGLFCWVHVFAARHTVAWARRRFQMGLSGFIPWEDSEETYSVLRKPDTEEMAKNSDRGCGIASSSSPAAFGFLGDWSADVPAESLADVDSKFADVCGIRVHYKEVWPSGLLSGSRGQAGTASPGSSASSDADGASLGGSAASVSGNGGAWDSGTGIVLVHGFGGGVFAWRHIMEALALQCQCRVVAFDRPAFGLTSRPVINHEQRHNSSNPYSMGAQAELMMQLCTRLGLRKVLLLAHADACLLALRAASLSAEQALLQEAAAAAAAACAGRAGCMGEDIETDEETSACCGDSAPPHTTLTIHADYPSVNTSSALVAATSCATGVAAQLPPLTTCSLFSATGLAGGGLTAGSVRRRAGSLAAFNLVESASPLSPSSSLVEAIGNTEDSESEDPGSPQYSVRLSSEHHSPATLANEPMRSETSGVTVLPAVAGTASPSCNSRRNSRESSTLLGVDSENAASTSCMSGGFEGPEALIAASYALGTNVGIKGGSCTFPGSPASGRCTPPCSGTGGLTEACERSAAMIPSSASMGGPLLAQSDAYRAPRHRRCLSVPMPLEASSSVPDPHPVSLEPPFDRETHAAGSWPMLLGLVLLHPNLVGPMGPTLSRLLSMSTLGRSILRPLLRSEVGEVANRRAWHHAERLTPEVLDLYKAPLRVEGWDTALMETARLGREQTQGDLAAHLSAARLLPTLVVTATDDYIATLAKVEQLCATSLPEAQTAVLSDCGHLSHEEAPGLLLQELMPFCGQVLLPHQH